MSVSFSQPAIDIGDGAAARAASPIPFNALLRRKCECKCCSTEVWFRFAVSVLCGVSHAAGQALSGLGVQVSTTLQEGMLAP
jgi:hypothetical protein